MFVESTQETRPAASWVDPDIAAVGIDAVDLDDADLVKQIEAWERQARAAAAAQARLTAELHARRVRGAAEAGEPAARRGRGVGHEVALARLESPARGREHTVLALALVHDLPETLAALARGDIDEYRAQIVARESADLCRADRAVLDATLGPQVAGMGVREITVATRRMVLELDERAAEQRAERARVRRRVTTRGLPDAMARLSAEIGAEDAQAAIESLREHADLRRAMGDERSRDQVMADELVARLCAPAVAGARPVEIQLVMNAEMLLGEDDATPAHLVGYGPLPAGTARRILAEADGRVLVRRLFAHPLEHHLVAMDSRGIVFPRALRRLLFARDGEACRTPWCDAPVRHADHVTARARGGRTTFDGGQGLCEACNYAKESPGWRHRTTSEWPQRHHVEITTPAGHTHDSHAPPLPVRASPTRPHVITVEIYRPAPELRLALAG
ncbi:HNH endonuclease [Nocardioides sp. cx-169]|uniref:HNH endonuclease n=1 Tax=Nocardioides sp. cx-169 TaxID=2899080 RepID=UPI001E5DEDA7|nr:HNH endonuclease signature motif containing protein [Nocardioides sp. cx-169]MCD4534032.1 HNH endonuclease [Nocardioides sp. cx-169]